VLTYTVSVVSLTASVNWPFVTTEKWRNFDLDVLSAATDPPYQQKSKLGHRVRRHYRRYFIHGALVIALQRREMRAANERRKPDVKPNLKRQRMNL